ncbi:2-isopropylmalate synthase [Actinomycetes bacterium KLBMP 9759]
MTRADRPKAAASRGEVVIWEECARDGAQAKTIMSGAERVAVARRTGSIFGAGGPDHVIFAAGFPAIGPQEVRAMRELAEEVENCSLASHGRATRHDIELGLTALRDAAHPRVTFWIPVSDAVAHTLGIASKEAALARGLDCLAFAQDIGDGVPVDVALVDARPDDPGPVVAAVDALSGAGAGIVKVCDTVGRFFPRQTAAFLQAVGSRTGTATVGVHLHNDLGLALANNLEAVAAGVRVVASSWLGLGERTGLAATEQLLVALSGVVGAPETALGTPAPLWADPPDLHGVVPVAHEVSRVTGVPMKITDAIVGPGVNTISTGTPFLDRDLFRPFDPLAVLGVHPHVAVTQLASRRVLQAVAAERGLELDDAVLDAALRWVKQTAYERNTSIVDKDELFAFVAGLVAVGAR